MWSVIYAQLLERRSMEKAEIRVLDQQLQESRAAIEHFVKGKILDLHYNTSFSLLFNSPVSILNCLLQFYSKSTASSIA